MLILLIVLGASIVNTIIWFSSDPREFFFKRNPELRKVSIFDWTENKKDKYYKIQDVYSEIRLHSVAATIGLCMCIFFYICIFVTDAPKYKDSFSLVGTEKITDIDIIGINNKTVRYIEDDEVKEMEVDNTYIDDETYILKSTYRDLFLTTDIYDL